MEELSTLIELMNIKIGGIASDVTVKSISNSSIDMDPTIKVSEVIIDDSFEDMKQCAKYFPTTNILAITYNGVPKLLMKVRLRH
jgi:hypothetical protein